MLVLFLFFIFYFFDGMKDNSKKKKRLQIITQCELNGSLQQQNLLRWKINTMESALA